MKIKRRDILALVGVSSAAAALPGALRAEGMKSGETKVALPYALTTPIHIGQAALRVRDLDRMVKYYREMLGLREISQEDDTVVLGAGDTPLLHLVHTPDAALERAGSAGLYHIAYLMPERADLARWLVHIAREKIPVTGFADHSVSEAVYLTDPEGNGVEVYSDRPRETWTWTGDVVTMGSHPLNIDDILSLTDTNRDTYLMAPDRLRIGHIHLRVGDVEKAAAFYGGVIGLSPTRDNRRDAGFYSSGRYHHHLAFNTWESKGAELRSDNETGLDWFSLALTGTEAINHRKEVLKRAGKSFTKSDDIITVLDPWGTRVRFVEA